MPGKSLHQQSQPSELYLDNNLLLPPPFYESPPPPPQHRRARAYRTDRRMPKQRRSLSLQAILIPSFFQTPLTSPTSPTFSRSGVNPTTSPTPNGDVSYFGAFGQDSGSIPTTPAITSPRASPPPSFLLDDDPFANLTCAPSEIQRTQASAPQTPQKPIDPGSQQQQQQPRSPLTPGLPAERIPAPVPSSPAALVKSPPRPPSKSFPRTPVPAYQKPAFAPKPSLPSLNDLSRMNFVLTKKVRESLFDRLDTQKDLF